MKKIICILLSCVMLMSITTTTFASDVCDHDTYGECVVSSDLNSDAVVFGYCSLGHWFKTTTTGYGGACYVEYNQKNGTNYQCYISVWEKVTCDRCGYVISHEEVDRIYGTCKFTENH